MRKEERKAKVLAFLIDAFLHGGILPPCLRCRVRKGNRAKNVKIQENINSYQAEKPTTMADYMMNASKNLLSGSDVAKKVQLSYGVYKTFCVPSSMKGAANKGTNLFYLNVGGYRGEDDKREILDLLNNKDLKAEVSSLMGNVAITDFAMGSGFQEGEIEWPKMQVGFFCG